MLSAAQILQRKKAASRPRPRLPDSGDNTVVFLGNVGDGITSALALHDKRLGFPGDWNEAKIRQQFISEYVKAEQIILEYNKQVGNSFSKEKITERDERHAATFKSALASVTDLVASLVQPNEIHAAQVKAREWIDKVLSECANALEGK